MSSTVGKVKAKGLFKYVSLSMPELTEAPMGKLKSMMILHLLELGLFLVIKGDIWEFLIGFSLNGPNRAAYLHSSSIWTSTSLGNWVTDI